MQGEIVPTGRVAWSCVGVQQFESAWIGGQRLAWLNGWPHYKWINGRNDVWGLASRHGIQLDGQFAYGAVDDLKYCPECMKHYFHCDAFQMAAATHCPYHRVPLVKGCPHCCKPVSLTPWRFLTRGQFRPLRFPCCGQWLGGDPPTLEPSALLDASFIETFQVVDRFLRHLGNLMAWNREVDGSPIAATTILASLDPSVPFPDWCTRAAIKLVACPRHLDLRDAPFEQRAAFAWKRLRGKTWLRPSTAAAMLGGAIAELENTESILRACVRRLCGHVHSEPLRCTRWPSERLEYSAQHCPACAALEFWKACYSQPFAWRQHMLDCCAAAIHRNDFLRRAHGWIFGSPEVLRAGTSYEFVRCCMEVGFGVRLARGEIQDRTARLSTAGGLVDFQPLTMVDYRSVLLLPLSSGTRFWQRGYRVEGSERRWFAMPPIDAGTEVLAPLVEAFNTGPLWDAPPLKSGGMVWPDERWYCSLLRYLERDRLLTVRHADAVAQHLLL